MHAGRYFLSVKGLGRFLTCMHRPVILCKNHLGSASSLQFLPAMCLSPVTGSGLQVSGLCACILWGSLLTLV